MTRAGLQGKRGSAELPSRSQRCSHGLEEEDQALEARCQNRWSQLGRRTHSRGKSGLRWHQNLSLSCPSQCWSPYPSPPWSFPAAEWLHCSMENLKLQPKSWESKAREWEGDASQQKEEKPRKQVQVQVDKELGEEPDLPLDLTHFLQRVQPQSKGMLPVWLLGHPHPPKALRATLSWQEEPDPKFWQQLPPVDPVHGPGQGWQERGQTLWGIPTTGSQKRCLNPAILIPTGGGRLRHVESST